MGHWWGSSVVFTGISVDCFFIFAHSGFPFFCIITPFHHS
jgi:hypothetical protein